MTVVASAPLNQELERMNVLLAEARRTLEQLKKGLEVVDAPMLWHVPFIPAMQMPHNAHHMGLSPAAKKENGLAEYAVTLKTTACEESS